MADITIHPESDSYYRHIQALRKRIAQAIALKEDLVSVVCPNLSMEYYIHLEPKETKLFKLQCDCKRLKREIALIQRYINQQEAIDTEEIQKILNLEYQEYDKAVKKQYELRQKALDRKSRLTTMSTEERLQINAAYRKIVPKLHPDLNPKATAKQLDLLKRANDALKYGDSKSMNDILLQVQEMNLLDYKPPEAVPQLKQEMIKYAKQYNAVIREIIDIKKDFPYNMKQILSSKDEIQNKLLQIQSEIQKTNAVIAQYKEHKKALLTNHE